MRRCKKNLRAKVFLSLSRELIVQKITNLWLSLPNVWVPLKQDPNVLQLIQIMHALKFRNDHVMIMPVNAIIHLIIHTAQLPQLLPELLDT